MTGFSNYKCEKNEIMINRTQFLFEKVAVKLHND